VGVGVIERGADPAGWAIGAGFNCEGALPHGGAHGFGRENLCDTTSPTEAAQPSGREDDGGVLAFIELAEARIDVAADGFEAEIGTEAAELRGAAQRAGSDGLARLKFGKLSADNCIAGIFPLRDGGDGEARGQFGWQIFQTVHGEMGASIEKGFLDFLGEQAFAASGRTKVGEGSIGDFIAGRLYYFDVALVASLGEARFHPACLPERELRAARRNSQVHWSCKWKAFRMASTTCALSGLPA
jgi:hypothetical protein